MIVCPTVTKSSIRNHYDLTTPFYRLLWGPHIHHGFWEHDESPRTAQLKLTERLADLAGVQAGDQVIDVGCGMGGSSIHLARARGCGVQGVTISRVQRMWATLSAQLRGLGTQVRFRCIDAESLELPAESADVVWSIECTEHLFDKPRFFARAASWLRPGGRVAICAWLAGSDLDTDRQQQVYDVCEGFLCPSLGTQQDYCDWLMAAGLEMRAAEDWTPRVLQTWQICRDRQHRSGVRWLAPLFGNNTVLFLDRFETILNAYCSGAMQYGCFVAARPGE